MAMIVYVETNFILEIALQQEQAAAAEEMLKLAEAGRIELVIPVFSLCEPYSAVAFLAVERARAVEQLQRVLEQGQPGR